MRVQLLDLLVCPACAGELESSLDAWSGEHVVSGSLSCSACRHHYAIVRGVPRMNVAMKGLERVAQTFGFEWKAHHGGRLEDDTLFGQTLDQDWAYFLEATGLDDDRLQGMIVLDAGCGSGRPTRQMAEHGAATVVGVDFNEAVDEAYAATADLPNVHIVQANVFSLPFRKPTFDLVWSNGVIHHTPDAVGAHAALSDLVEPGGILYVWVYAKRFNPFRFTKDVLDALRITRLPEPVLLRVAQAFSYASMLPLAIYRTIRTAPGLRPRTAWGRRTVRARTVQELQLTWFDALSPEYDSRHSEAEVVGWFRGRGFDQIKAIEEPKLGVRGRAPEARVQP